MRAHWMMPALGLLGACADDPTQRRWEYLPDMVSSVAPDSYAPIPAPRYAAGAGAHCNVLMLMRSTVLRKTNYPKTNFPD